MKIGYINKTNLIHFLILLLSVLWLLPTFDVGGNDREIFRFIGRSIGTGLIPYKDVFDHKMPFIYLIFLFFKPFNNWDIFVSGTLFLIISLSIFKYLLRNTSSFLSLFTPIILMLWLRNPFFYEFGGLTREYTCYLYCLYFFAFHLKKQYLESVILGLIFINQPNDILPLIPFLLLGLKDDLTISKILKAFLLFCFPSIIITIWLFSNNCLSDFWTQNFAFNYKYYTSSMSIISPYKLYSFIVNIGLKLHIIIVGLLIFPLLIFFKKSIKMALLVCSSLLLAFYNIALSGQYYGHYFLPLGVIVCFSSLLFSNTSKTIFKMIKFALILIVIGLSYSFFQFDYKQLMVQSNLHRQRQNLIENEIIKYESKTKHIFFINYSPGLIFNYKFRKRPPSKYIYFSPWEMIPNWDKNLNEFGKVIRSLENKKGIIFDFSEAHPFKRMRMNKMLQATLKNNYILIKKFNNSKQKLLFNIYIPR